MDVVNVDPLNTLQEIASSLNSTLQPAGNDFQVITSSFGDPFNSVSVVIDAITNSNNIQLALDSLLDVSVSVDLSLTNFEFDVQVNELAAAFSANIGGDFTINVGNNVEVDIQPLLQVNLFAVNTATPFSLISSSALSNLAQFEFGGSFDALLSFGIAGGLVPAQISLRASSQDLVSQSALCTIDWFHCVSYPVFMLCSPFIHTNITGGFELS